MTYETIATLSQVTSLLMFIGMFLVVLVYALRARNASAFEKLQRRALDLERPAESDKGAA